MLLGGTGTSFILTPHVRRVPHLHMQHYPPTVGGGGGVILCHQLGGGWGVKDDRKCMAYVCVHVCRVRVTNVAKNVLSF